MEADRPNKNWKLELRYGKRQTPYRHYTAIAVGVAGQLIEGFTCPPGNAVMGMKTWASSPEESADMIHEISDQIGFAVKGKVRVYDTEPTQPPREDPYGYDITFTPFASE